VPSASVSVASGLRIHHAAASSTTTKTATTLLVLDRKSRGILGHCEIAVIRDKAELISPAVSGRPIHEADMSRIAARTLQLCQTNWCRMLHRMSTITAILEPNPDGTVHLPLPVELRGSKVKVTATLEASSPESTAAVADWPARREAALVALNRIRKRGGIQSIPDPAAWQEETRKDRALPGRER
jgi:hypothetical protein